MEIWGGRRILKDRTVEIIEAENREKIKEKWTEPKGTVGHH